MKFINYLETISGIGIFPLTSLIIFFMFFIILGIKVYLMDNQLVNQISNLPIEDEPSSK